MCDLGQRAIMMRREDVKGVCVCVCDSNDVTSPVTNCARSDTNQILVFLAKQRKSL